MPWGDHLLVDGGVVNNTPISHAIELGAERVFVLPTSDPDERGLADRPRRPLDAAVQACKVLVGARLKADLVRYAAEAELIVLRAPNRTRVQPNDFDQAELLIARRAARGASAARRARRARGGRGLTAQARGFGRSPSGERNSDDSTSARCDGCGAAGRVVRNAPSGLISTTWGNSKRRSMAAPSSWLGTK